MFYWLILIGSLAIPIYLRKPIARMPPKLKVITLMPAAIVLAPVFAPAYNLFLMITLALAFFVAFLINHRELKQGVAGASGHDTRIYKLFLLPCFILVAIVIGFYTLFFSLMSILLAFGGEYRA